MLTNPVLVFDLGKVIVDFDHRRATRALARYCSYDPDQIYRLLFAQDSEQRHSLGAISSPIFYESTCALLQLSLGYAEFARLWSDIFTERPLMTQLVAQLRDQHMLIVCSNTDPLHVEWLQTQYRFLESFHAAIYSYKVHALKPDPAIYKAVEQASGQPPEAHLFLDDLPDNVAAALTLGWEAFIVESVPQLIAELRRRHIALPLWTDHM